MTIEATPEDKEVWLHGGEALLGELIAHMDDPELGPWSILKSAAALEIMSRSDPERVVYAVWLARERYLRVQTDAAFAPLLADANRCELKRVHTDSERLAGREAGLALKTC